MLRKQQASAVRLPPWLKISSENTNQYFQLLWGVWFVALRMYKMLPDTARTEEALPLAAQTLDWGWQWRTGKEHREGPQERPGELQERDALQLSRNPSCSLCSKAHPRVPNRPKSHKIHTPLSLTSLIRMEMTQAKFLFIS